MNYNMPNKSKTDPMHTGQNKRFQVYEGLRGSVADRDINIDMKEKMTINRVLKKVKVMMQSNKDEEPESLEIILSLIQFYQNYLSESIVHQTMFHYVQVYVHFHQVHGPPFCNFFQFEIYLHNLVQFVTQLYLI